MVKKAFIISAVLIVVIIIISIVISLINLKPATFQSVVHYDENINIITEAPETSYYAANAANSDSFLFTDLMKYEKTVVISTIIIAIIFILLFYGTKRSKGW